MKIIVVTKSVKEFEITITDDNEVERIMSAGVLLYRLESPLSRVRAFVYDDMRRFHMSPRFLEVDWAEIALPEHESNDWIVSKWKDKKVKQIGGDLIGRTGTVSDTMWDEKGALHCFMKPGSWWCPASLLEITE